MMSQQDQLEFWTQALNLPDFRVVHQRRDTPADPLCLTVCPKVLVGLCPHCHHPTDCVQRTHDSARVKDLPLGPQAIELVVRTPQFHCERCHRYFTPPYPAFAPGAHATERFLEHAAKLIRFADIANAAAFLGVPEQPLARWYYDYAQRRTQTPAEDLKPIKSLGIDELSQKNRTGSS